MKDDLIRRREVIAALGERPMVWVDGDYELGARNQYDCDRLAVETAPTVDAVPVVRCKDCKHRPTGTDRYDLEFPDDKCPCQCEDFWYSWKPADDWFCGNGKRKDGEQA